MGQDNEFDLFAESRIITAPNGNLDAVADACVTAHAVIDAHGTGEMKALIRVLLYVVGREIVRGRPAASQSGTASCDNDA